MTKRIARLALALGAAAALAAPAVPAQATAIPCTGTTVQQCVKELLSADISEICVPTGDLEDDCHWG